MKLFFFIAKMKPMEQFDLRIGFMFQIIFLNQVTNSFRVIFDKSLFEQNIFLVKFIQFSVSNFFKNLFRLTFFAGYFFIDFNFLFDRCFFNFFPGNSKRIHCSNLHCHIFTKINQYIAAILHIIELYHHSEF